METVTVDFEEVDRWDQALRYLNPDELMNLWVEQGLAEHTVLKISGQENGVALAIELARRYKEWIERSLQRRMSHIVANIADKASNTLKLSFELGKGHNESYQYVSTLPLDYQSLPKNTYHFGLSILYNYQFNFKNNNSSVN